MNLNFKGCLLFVIFVCLQFLGTPCNWLILVINLTNVLCSWLKVTSHANKYSLTSIIHSYIYYVSYYIQIYIISYVIILAQSHLVPCHCCVKQFALVITVDYLPCTGPCRDVWSAVCQGVTHHSGKSRGSHCSRVVSYVSELQ